MYLTKNRTNYPKKKYQPNNNNYNLSSIEFDTLSRSKGTLSRNEKPLFMGYTTNDFQKSAVNKRSKTPYHLMLDSADSLSYTNFLQRAKQKIKSNNIIPIKQKKFGVSRNNNRPNNTLKNLESSIITNKTLESRANSANQSGNGVKTIPHSHNSGNVVNILNGPNDKSVEINFNKYEIKILSDRKTLKKGVTNRKQSPLNQKRVNTIFHNIKEGTEDDNILIRTRNIASSDTFIKSNSVNNDINDNGYNTSGTFCLSERNKKSPILSYVNKGIQKKIFLKKKSSKSLQHREDKSNNQNFTVISEISITCPNVIETKKSLVPCVENNFCFSSSSFFDNNLNSQRESNKDEDITIKDHYSVNSHFTLKRNQIMKKQSTRITSTFATDAENNYLSAGCYNSTNENEVNLYERKIMKKFQKMNTDNLNRYIHLNQCRKAKSVANNISSGENSFDYPSIQFNSKGERFKEFGKKDDTYEDNTLNNKSLSLNNTLSSMSPKMNKSIEENHQEKEEMEVINTNGTFHRASTLQKMKNPLNNIYNGRKKPLSKEIKTLKLNLKKIPTRNNVKPNKKFLRQLSRISEISNRNKRNSINQLNSTTSITNKKTSKNKSCINLSISKSDIFSSSSEKFLIKRPKSYTNIISNIPNLVELIIAQIQKNEKVIQEENVSSSSSRGEDDIDDSTDHQKVSRTNTLKNYRSDAQLSKNLSRTSSLQFMELRSNSIKKTEYKFQNDITDEHRIKFLNSLKEQTKDYLTTINNNALEDKDEILNKILLILDIKHNKLNEFRNNLAKGYSTKQLNKINNFYHSEVDFINSILDTKKEEKKQIFGDLLLNKINYLSNKKLPSLGYYLINNFFQVNLYELIYLKNYLESDIVKDINGVETLFHHFTQKNKVFNRQRTSKLSKHSKFTRYKTSTFIKKISLCGENINGFFLNRFFVFDNEVDKKILYGEVDKYYRDKQIWKKTLNGSSLYKGSNKSLRKNTQLSNKGKVGGLSKKSTKYCFKKSTLSFNNSFHHLENDCSFNQNKKDIKILTKEFYERVRDVIGNFDFQKMNHERMTLENLLKKQTEQLFISPFNRVNSIIKKEGEDEKEEKENAPLNKESMMYRTHEIKSEILRECRNYEDILFFYIKDGNYQNFIELFYKHHVNLEVKDKDGNTFLNLAVQCDCDKIVTFLLKKGSNVNTQNNKLNTPLHYALSYQNFGLSDLLIKSGANENIENLKGLTPWQCLDTSYTIV